MVIKSLALIFLIAPAILARPQLISFKDGKIGVNWGGYHAEAGLGGLLTGNAAHGGLSASAGTPQGQIAGAGLGGNLNDGLSNGGLFAGASSGFGQGASAALGGNSAGGVASGGYGAEAHSGDASKRVLGVGHAANGQSAGVSIVETANPAENSIVGSTQLGTRFAEVEAAAQPEVVSYTKTKYKTKVTSNSGSPASYGGGASVGAGYGAGTGYGAGAGAGAGAGSFFDSIFNIPISTLTAVNQLLNGGVAGGAGAYSAGGTVQKSVSHSVNASPASAAGGVHSGVSFTGTATRSGSIFDHIFNIPISTLNAVNQFLNGKASSVSVQKTIVHS